MPGISVKLPLSLDKIDGPFTLNKTLKEATKQNLKNLVLTSPGERIMDPLFGCGIRNFLFENNDNFTSNEISGRIRDQVRIYLPHITIVDIKITNTQNADPLSDMGPHDIAIKLTYVIKQINTSDELDIKF